MFEISNLRRVPGKHVVGPDGERIGKVVDVYESTDGDGATFATVSTGLLSTSASFFPLDDAELRGDEIVVPYSKDVVKHAPRVANDEDLTADEEQQLFAYYRHARSGAPASAAAPGAGSSTADDGTMTRHEERLEVGTERVETGRARLRKYVVVETVTQSVPVSHQELRIVREPLTGHQGTTDRFLTEEEHELVLSAERPVVDKVVVPVERITLDTETVVGEETVTEQIRKEQVEVEQEAVAPRPVGAPVTGPVEEHIETTSEFVVEPRREVVADDAPATTTELVVEPRH